MSVATTDRSPDGALPSRRPSRRRVLPSPVSGQELVLIGVIELRVDGIFILLVGIVPSHGPGCRRAFGSPVSPPPFAHRQAQFPG